jgi:hypothetical protein
MEIKLAQPLILLAFITLLLLTLRGTKIHSKLISRLGFIGLVFLFSIAIMFPELTSQLANLIGIGRGADLVLYASTTAFLIFAVLVTKKINEIQRNLSKIIGLISIIEYQNKDKK